MDRAVIIKILSSKVSGSRLAHCLRVERTAQEMAARFGAEPELVTPAALLHDLCREYDPDLLLKLAGNFGIVIDDIEKTEPLLLHGAVAAALARSELGIANPQVLEAIAYHITGGPKLSPLAKLVYVADFIEPGRSNCAARDLRKEAPSMETGLLLLKVYNRTHEYLIKNNYLIHPRGIAGRNELIMKGITEK